MSTADDIVISQLLKAEEDFLFSIGEGEEAVVAFDSKWSALRLTIEQAGSLSHSTVSLATDVASSISILAKSFLSLELEVKKISEELYSSYQEVLTSGSGCPDASRSGQDSRQSSRELQIISRSSCADQDSYRPSFIHACYKWLLDNLDNPYPSKDVKESIARSTAASISSIDAWFQSARRRIGWTSLSKQCFNNCRIDMVDAATRFFADPEDKNQADARLTHEFMDIKVKAQDLCSRIFKKSKLAAELDVAVKDMTEKDRVELDLKKKEEQVAEKRRKDLEKELRRLERAKERTEDKLSKEFPRNVSPSSSRDSSPGLSRTPSLTLSQSSESDDADEIEELEEFEDITPPEPVAGRKRRRDALSSNPDEDDYDLYKEPTSKRHRPTHADVSVETLVAKDAQNADNSDHWTVDVSNSLVTQPDTTPSRKRRLSDADAQSVPKRPRGLHPRQHAVSDPLPSSHSSVLNEPVAWDWDNMFKVDLPVCLQPINSGLHTTTNLDIELAKDWSTFDMYDALSASGSSPSESPTLTGTGIDVPEADLLLATSPGFDVSSFFPPCDEQVGDGYLSVPESPVDLPARQTCSPSNDAPAYHVAGITEFDWPESIPVASQLREQEQPSASTTALTDALPLQPVTSSSVVFEEQPPASTSNLAGPVPLEAVASSSVISSDPLADFDYDISRLLTGPICQQIEEAMYRSGASPFTTFIGFDSSNVSPSFSTNDELLALDKQKKRQQLAAYREAAAQIERELLVAS